MRFKPILFAGLVGLLLACQESGNPADHPVDPISTIEEIEEILFNINYEVTLPSGVSVVFNPSERFPSLRSQNYTDVQGFNFVDRATNNFTVSSLGSGFLELGQVTYNFQSVFCLTIRDLENRYGFTFDPAFRDWIVFYGATVSNVTESQIVLGDPVVENLLVAFVDDVPGAFGTFEGNRSFTFSTQDNFFFLDGGYDLSSNLASISSAGSAFDTSFGVFLTYDFALNCN